MDNNNNNDNSANGGNDKVTKQRVGRPRQPYCPDCIKTGIQGVAKKPGYGYCPDHVALRMRSYKRAEREDISLEYAREKELIQMATEARTVADHLREVVKQHESTIVNLVASMEAEGARDEDRYLHPDGPDAHDRDQPRGLEEDYKALVGTYKDFRDWVKAYLAKNDVEPPMHIKAYLSVKFEDEVGGDKDEVGGDNGGDKDEVGGDDKDEGGQMNG